MLKIENTEVLGWEHAIHGIWLSALTPLATTWRASCK